MASGLLLHKRIIRVELMYMQNQDSTQNTLIHLNTFNLIEQHLNRIPTNKADFYNNAFVGYSEFGLCEINKWSNSYEFRKQ